MRENLKTVLFVASVALNLVFVATYAIYRLPVLAGMHQPSVSEGPLFLHLNLTSDQLKQFRVERDGFHARLQKLGQEIREKQLELIELLEAMPPDRQTIAGKQEEIQGLQRSVQNGVIAHFLRAGTFLTPEQRDRFFELIKSHIQTGLQACPPMMRPVEQCEPGAAKNK